MAIVFFSPHVADTISKLVLIRPHDHAYVPVVLAGLTGAILWDLITWRWGLPTSSSHALVGGIAGAGMAYAGPGVLHMAKLIEIMCFIFVAPCLGFLCGTLSMLLLCWVLRAWRPQVVDSFFRRAQLFSAGIYSLGHGGNDAQKTMGIIIALLVASGDLAPPDSLEAIPWWIILSCNAAMAIGTSFGGWRIVKTMGMKITKLQPLGGFCAEVSGAFTLILSTYWGIPVSTTHTITGSIIGVGSSKSISKVRWGVARQILWAWVSTMPAAGILSAVCFWLFKFLFFIV
jgi:PiT family inorganic phosphate transporter